MTERQIITCPECGVSISAYVPARGDGSDLKLPMHKHAGHVGRQSQARPWCNAGGRMAGEYRRTQAQVERLYVRRSEGRR